MKQIKQFRYYDSTNINNYPQFINYYGKLVNGNIFESLGAISSLGIQGIPGTKFYLNGASFPITIGKTGIYELDLGEHGRIHSIKFDRQSLEDYYTPDDTNRLLIDVLYEGGNL